jgi:hypothetical protein
MLVACLKDFYYITDQFEKILQSILYCKILLLQLYISIDQVSNCIKSDVLSYKINDCALKIIKAHSGGTVLKVMCILSLNINSISN